MLPRLALLVVGIIVSTATLLLAAPAALADPWASCAPPSPDDQVVRVFPRTAVAPGPVGTTSELQCGDRYFGVRRIEAEWAGVPDWRATADAAISRALLDGPAPIYDARSDTWAYTAPGVVVTIRPRGLIIDARPETHAGARSPTR